MGQKIILTVKTDQKEIIPNIFWTKFGNSGHSGYRAETLNRETIESGPLCITDLFQNKSVAYFFNFFQLFQK